MESQQQSKDESLLTQDPDTNFSSGPLAAAPEEDDDDDATSGDDDETAADEEMDGEL